MFSCFCTFGFVTGEFGTGAEGGAEPATRRLRIAREADDIGLACPTCEQKPLQDPATDGSLFFRHCVLVPRVVLYERS